MTAQANEPRELLTARLTLAETPSIVEELQQRAIRGGRSVSDEVRLALRLYLEQTRSR